MHRKIGGGSLQRECNGKWTLRLMVDGQSINRSSGTRNKAKAKEMLRELVREQEAARARREASVRLLGAWDAIAPRLAASGLDEAGVARKRRIWRAFAEWMHENHPEVADCEGVTEDMADEYIRIMGEERSASSRNTHLYALRGMFDILHGEGEWPNPWKHICRHSVKAHCRRSLSMEELERLVAAAGEFGDEWKALVLLGVNTGQSVPGCCALTWGDVNLHDGTIRMQGRDGNPRILGVNANLRDALAAMHSDGARDNLLAGIARIARRRPMELKATLARIFAAAGIETSARIEGRRHGSPDASFLSLRATFIEFAARNGTPLAEVKAIVGSKGSYVGKHYRAAIERIEAEREDSYASLAQRLAEMGELLRLGLVTRREYDKTCRRMCRQAR